MNAHCLITTEERVHEREDMGGRKVVHLYYIQQTKSSKPPQKTQITPSVVTIIEKPYQCSLCFDLLFLLPLVFLPSCAFWKVLLPTYEELRVFQVQVLCCQSKMKNSRCRIPSQLFPGEILF